MFASGLGVVFGVENGVWDVVSMNLFCNFHELERTRGRQIALHRLQVAWKVAMYLNHWARCKISVKQAGIFTYVGVVRRSLNIL